MASAITYLITDEARTVPTHEKLANCLNTSRKSQDTGAAVFILVTIAIWILSTIHVGINLYRLLRAYVWLGSTIGPAYYLQDPGRWDNIAHDLVTALTTWLADLLLIYRGFLVWNNNIYIIYLPILLLCLSIAACTVALHLLTAVSLEINLNPALAHWTNATYVLSLIQNTLTSGLITYRLWSQELASRSMGVPSVRNDNFMPILYILVAESGAIYVVELLVLLILYALKHSAQFIVQDVVVPTVGILFTFMTIRIAVRYNKKATTCIGESTAESTQSWRVPSRHINHVSQSIGSAVIVGNIGREDSSIQLRTIGEVSDTGDDISEIKFASNHSA
ncbi:hypothetical protein P691DRAFT_761217 [Macrolepiota fuliginosa MF-IS2]|uniref:Uncharacterized protein n=1 Tax=Macrolepiota fuliginosa MF-IS2 TaxID=1400762 RepID=A0A9P5XBD7_9AGAR|nr:hypothetical protein P691DRAFT_761217 [Macrolepiota fuliginosa MF-IS2]